MNPSDKKKIRITVLNIRLATAASLNYFFGLWTSLQNKREEQNNMKKQYS